MRLGKIGDDVGQIGNNAGEFVQVSLRHQVIVRLHYHMREHVGLPLRKNLQKTGADLRNRGHGTPRGWLWGST